MVKKSPLECIDYLRQKHYAVKILKQRQKMKAIPEFENYFATKNGRVYSQLSKKYLKLTLGNHGYLTVSLCKEYTQKTASVHRLVLETYTEPCPKGMECRHLNGNRQDNRLKNLKWGTRVENIKDRQGHGKTAKGEKNGAAKLTKRDVKTIRRLHQTGAYTWRKLGKMFCIAHSHVGRIVVGKNWKHI